MSIGKSADAERVERNHRANGLVGDETSRNNIYAHGHAYFAAVLRSLFARSDTALGPITGIAPRHEVEFLLQRGIQVSVSRADQGFALIALRRGNHAPILTRRPLEVIVDIEKPVAGLGDQRFD